MDTDAVVVGGYRIERTLGAGGMGVVYRALDVRLERAVALKVLKLSGLRPESQATRRARFEREGKAAARIRSPHVAQVLHLGEADNGDPFLVMELVEGRTLADVLSAERWLEPRRVVELGRQICAGMSAAHALGVVHRDLKPSNLMLLDDGTAKILDFGVAKLVGSERTEGLTRHGELVGTLVYMAPEQVEGGSADARTDVYALGTVLYEMLVGARPFEGRSVTELMQDVAHKPPPSLVDRAARPLPRRLVEAVHRCLEKDPARRFQSMDELAAALVDTDTGPTAAPRVRHDAATRVNVPIAPSLVDVTAATSLKSTGELLAAATTLPGVAGDTMEVAAPLEGQATLLAAQPTLLAAQPTLLRARPGLEAQATLVTPLLPALQAPQPTLAGAPTATSRASAKGIAWVALPIAVITGVIVWWAESQSAAPAGANAAADMPDEAETATTTTTTAAPAKLPSPAEPARPAVPADSAHAEVAEAREPVQDDADAEEALDVRAEVRGEPRANKRTEKRAPRRAQKPRTPARTEPAAANADAAAADDEFERVRTRTNGGGR